MASNGRLFTFEEVEIMAERSWTKSKVLYNGVEMAVPRSSHKYEPLHQQKNEFRLDEIQGGIQY